MTASIYVSGIARRVERLTGLPARAYEHVGNVLASEVRQDMLVGVLVHWAAFLDALFFRNFVPS